MPKPFIIIIMLFVFSGVKAQGLKLEKGAEFAYAYHNWSAGLFANDESYLFSFKVLGKDDKGLYRLTCTLENAKGGANDVFDIGNIRNAKLTSSKILIPLILFKKPFIVVVDTSGRLVMAEGITELAAAPIRNWRLSESISTLLVSSLKSFPFYSLGSIFSRRREMNNSKGVEWIGDDRLTYRVVGIKGKTVHVQARRTEPDSTVKEISRNSFYNTSTGLIESTLQKTVLLNVSYLKPTEKVLCTSHEEIKRIYNYKHKADLDTAWVSMAMRGSWMSDALKTEGQYDSVKILNYFEKYGKPYQHDPYYMLTRLSLLQSSPSENAYDMYRGELIKTPNHLLLNSGSSYHLYNKLSAVLPINADSTYAIANCILNEAGLTDWLQNTFSQNFIRGRRYTDQDYSDMAERRKKEGYTQIKIDKELQSIKAERENTPLLLEKFHQDKNAVMQQKTLPLYLWVKAQKVKTNHPELLKVAAEMGKEDARFYKAGNAGRYNLLVYKMMEKEGLHKQAANLLDETILSLSKLAVDTLNEDFYAHRELLAYAYYMKYMSVEPTDSIRALSYLSKASQFSPATSKERPHRGSYDSYFLDSKESYRGEFIQKLIEKGESEQALSILVDHINANPEQMTELQQSYMKNVKGGDFSAFITNKVVKMWPAAPDFLLTDLNGEKHTLKDYKGNWLVLDFWGTWCPPCRTELPAVNKFYEELSAGKYSGIRFLSVACWDNESRVKEFLKVKKYSIPAAMSDQKVEKNYSIDGYPSKILVSPDGRMIALRYGKDWEAIVKAFNEVYKAPGNESGMSL